MIKYNREKMLPISLFTLGLLHAYLIYLEGFTAEYLGAILLGMIIVLLGWVLYEGL